MAKTLELIFVTATGKEATLSVEDPKENLTQLELQNGMQSIIAQNIFEVEGAAFTVAKAARIVERNVVELTI